jgi:hypothetical protein
MRSPPTLLDVVARALAHGTAAIRPPASWPRGMSREGRLSPPRRIPAWRAALRLVLDRRGIDAVTDDGSGDRLDGHVGPVAPWCWRRGTSSPSPTVRRRRALGDPIVALTAHGASSTGRTRVLGAAPGAGADADGHIARGRARVEQGSAGGRHPRISGHVSRQDRVPRGTTRKGDARGGGRRARDLEPLRAHVQSEVGLAPSFLTRLRLDVATALLARGERMSDVARSVGLFDASHLSRRLRRHAADGRRPRRSRAPSATVPARGVEPVDRPS